MSDLFISYSRRDQTFVRELHARLEKVGKDVWVDWENIPLTAEWLQEIYDGIEAGDAFAYVISPDSVRSEVCSLELAHAISHNKRLMPILRRDLVEDMDRKALDPKISSHNWIFFREVDDFEKAFHSLTDALDTDLDYLKMHTRLLIKAVEWNDKERDAALVLRGNDLRAATQWLQQSTDKQPIPTDLQREYIQSSQRAATARVRALALYAVYGIVVILLAGFAFLQALAAESRRQEADQQRHFAEDNASTAVAAQVTAVYNGDQAHSLALASSAQQILYRDKNPELSLALALVANTSVENPPILAQGALAQAAYFPSTRYILNQGLEGYSRIAANPINEQALFANKDNALTLMDLNTKEMLQTWASPNAEDLISAVALTADGDYAAAGYNSGHIRIYKTSDGSAFKDFGDVDSGTLWDIEFSPDGKYLVAACSDGVGRVWNWRTGKNLLNFKGHIEANTSTAQPSLYAIAVRPDSKAVLTIDDTLGILYLWDIETGAILQSFQADVGAGRAVAFLPDGKLALVGYDDTVMRLIDLEQGTLKREYIGHSLLLWDIGVNINGTDALSGSYDNSIIHWDIATGEIIEEFKGHGSLVSGLAIAGSRFVSQSYDGALRYWDLASGAQINQASFKSDITDIYPTSNNADVIVGLKEGLIHVLDARFVSQKTITTPTGMSALDVNESKDIVVTGGEDGQVNIWSLSQGQLLSSKTLDFSIQAVDSHPEGEWIAIVGKSADIILWNWKTDENRSISTATAEALKDRDPRIKTVQFSPTGTQILVGGANGISNSVYLFDFTSGSLINEFTGHTGIIYSTTFSNDGRYIASASEDNSLIVWRIDGSEPPRHFYGHTDDIAVIRFSPNSRLLVSGSYDRTIRLWDVNTSSEIQRFDTQSPISAVVFDNQSSSIFTGTFGGDLQHWQIRDLTALLKWVDTNRYIPTLTCEQQKLYQISQTACDIP